MKFGSPENLLWLWVAIPLILFFLWSWKHRHAMLDRFSQEDMFRHIAAGYNPKAVRLKNILILGVLIFCFLSLARPQWGYQLQEIKRKGVDILLVVDVSRSMLTADVKPNRLERTKLAIRDLLKRLKGDRIGLMSFAGDAFLTCPLTVDYGGFVLSLQDLDVHSVPRGGTNLSAAIRKAMQEYETTGNKYKAIVIITDGDNLEEDPMPEVQKAKDKGIKIFTIGVGTQEGELIRVPNDKGEMDFLKDNQGNFVKSRLNEDLLQKIALETGGVYVRASGSQFGLDLIYDREITKFEKQEYQSRTERRYFERFQIPLAVALILLLVEWLVPARRKVEEV